MCKECEKRGTIMTVAPLKRHYKRISRASIEEFCQWFRAGKIDIVTVDFEAEDVTVTIGLESEIETLEEALLISWLPSQEARLKEIMQGLTQ